MIANVWGKLRTLNDLGVLDNLTVFGVGKFIFCDPANGDDGNDGLSPTTTKKTLAGAYAVATAGKNDVIFLISDGTTASTARVDAAFTWAKNETHLIGICAPVLFSQRARIAPTGTTTAFANFFTVTASGCQFVNIEWFHGFNTGIAAAICMTITGNRNYFSKCQIAGMGDIASATDAGSRSLKIGSAGSGENTFEDCVIGLDTIARTVANASLELAGATPRNVFRRCYFPVYATNSAVLGILGTGANCIDRINIFDDCAFLNSIKSAGTTASVLISLTNAAPGGLLALKRCMSVGFTKFGDTNGLANSYIDMPAVSASAGGLGVNPS